MLVLTAMILNRLLASRAPGDPDTMPATPGWRLAKSSGRSVWRDLWPCRSVAAIVALHSRLFSARAAATAPPNIQGGFHHALRSTTRAAQGFLLRPGGFHGHRDGAARAGAGADPDSSAGRHLVAHRPARAAASGQRIQRAGAGTVCGRQNLPRAAQVWP